MQFHLSYKVWNINFFKVLIYCENVKLSLERIHEAVKELGYLKEQEDVGIGSLLALIYCHKKFTSVGTLMMSLKKNFKF